MGTALSVLKFAYDNRKAIGRAYHHFVKHKVVLDDLLDLAEESPKHPKNALKNQIRQDTIKSYDAA